MYATTNKGCLLYSCYIPLLRCTHKLLAISKDVSAALSLLSGFGMERERLHVTQNDIFSLHSQQHGLPRAATTQGRSYWSLGIQVCAPGTENVHALWLRAEYGAGRKLIRTRCRRSALNKTEASWPPEDPWAADTFHTRYHLFLGVSGIIFRSS